MKFRDFLKLEAGEDDPYQAFLRMRQGVFGPRPSATVKQTAIVRTPTMPPDQTRTVGGSADATRVGTRNPAEVQFSNEVQTGHKLGSVVPRAVVQRLAKHNPEELRSFVSPDILKAGRAYPFIQKRQAGKDVPGVIVYNPSFPLWKLLELLKIN